MFALFFVVVVSLIIVGFIFLLAVAFRLSGHLPPLPDETCTNNRSTKQQKEKAHYLFAHLRYEKHTTYSHASHDHCPDDDGCQCLPECSHFVVIHSLTTSMLVQSGLAHYSMTDFRGNVIGYNRLTRRR